MLRPRELFFFNQRIEQYWRSHCDLQGPIWHDMKQRFYVVCQTYTKEKNQWNLTALHKELLCLDISFLPLYFCLGCKELFSRPRGSRAGKNNVGIQEGNCTCCLFSTVSAVTPKTLHLYRPFHMSTPSISADRLERTFFKSLQLNPWMPLRWRLQNQQRMDVKPSDIQDWCAELRSNQYNITLFCAVFEHHALSTAKCILWLCNEHFFKLIVMHCINC